MAFGPVGRPARGKVLQSAPRAVVVLTDAASGCLFTPTWSPVVLGISGNRGGVYGTPPAEQACIATGADDRGAGTRAVSYHCSVSRGPQLFRRDAPSSERIFELIGGAVIVLGVPAFFFALFEIGTVFGVMGVVLVVGALGAGLIGLLR